MSAARASDVPPGIAAWARLRGPGAVLAAARTRMRRGRSTETGTLSGVILASEDRRQVARLLGTRWELSGRPVRLQDLAAKLDEHGWTVAGLVEALHGGQIEPDRVVRDRTRAAAAAERDRSAAILGAARVPDDAVWSWLSDVGLPRPGTGELEALAGRVATVLVALDRGTEGPTRLARLAADVVGDAHALDADRLLGRAVARLLAVRHGLSRPRRAGRDWRAAWASAGVVCDAVSSRVLVLNVPLTGTAPAARLAAAAPGEPVWLTLRSLAGAWSAPAVDVFVCENPTVAESAADALGAVCSPLVCTDGIASGAALDLLAGLAAAGCRIHARADFDPAGFTVADQVLSVAPEAWSWRYDPETYTRVGNRDALGVRGSEGQHLRDALDPLRRRFEAEQVAVHEERLLTALLQDLGFACGVAAPR